MHLIATVVKRLLLVAAALAVNTACAADVASNAATLIDVPVGTGPFPAAVVAPGQGYHMELPAIQQTARALVERGFVVYRFNWSYWVRQPKGAPSADLSVEVRDIQRVLAKARADRRVDAKRVVVVGKSLGSLVAWLAFRADASLLAAALLTPVCGEQVVGAGAPSAIAANYPGLSQESRPVFFALGNIDPVCEPKVLYRYASTAAGSVRINVVSGDHGFNAATKDGASLARNVGMVAAATAEFAAQAEAASR